MITFIHAADIHLDSALKGLERYEGAPVDEIRLATRRALENLVETALERTVDFVLIAGDLYDGTWKDHNTGLFFVRQMTRLQHAGIPVVMISGNHDAAAKMTKSLTLPENVELLPHRKPTTANSKRLADLGVSVHGQSFGKPAVLDNLAQDYPAKHAGRFNIGLLHTSLGGAEGHEPYAPCTVADLQQKEYDYWALGHVHTRRIVCEDPLIVYPGNIQGRHIRETGAKGCYIVSVDDQGRCELEFTPLDVMRWERCEVDLSGAERPEESIDRFVTELERLVLEHGDLPLAVRVELTGATGSHELLRADPLRWTNEIRAAAMGLPNSQVWIEKVRFSTSPFRPIEIDDPSSPIGTLLRCFAELEADESALEELSGIFADLQRKLPDELLQRESGLQIDDPAAIREWLSEVEPLLLTRLSRGAPP